MKNSVRFCEFVTADVTKIATPMTITALINVAMSVSHSCNHFVKEDLDISATPAFDVRAGPRCLNSFSASISGASVGLGCHAEGQLREVGVMECPSAKLYRG